MDPISNQWFLEYTCQGQVDKGLFVCVCVFTCMPVLGEHVGSDWGDEGGAKRNQGYVYNY